MGRGRTKNRRKKDEKGDREGRDRGKREGKGRRGRRGREEQRTGTGRRRTERRRTKRHGDTDDSGSARELKLALSQQEAQLNKKHTVYRSETPWMRKDGPAEENKLADGAACRESER